ncbi:MAG: hypothetical protein JW969_15065 [Spirochaetales bacterium]|nr:hypothetical protein [Spirochaetales bacterium]
MKLRQIVKNRINPLISNQLVALLLSLGLWIYILFQHIDFTIHLITTILFGLISLVLILSVKNSFQMKRINDKIAEGTDKGLAHLIELKFDKGGNGEAGLLSKNLTRLFREIKKVFWDIKENLSDAKISNSTLESMKLIMIEYIQKVVNIGDVHAELEIICKRITSATASTKSILSTIITLANQTNQEAQAIRQTSETLDKLVKSISAIIEITQAKQKMASELKELTDSGGDKVQTTYAIMQNLSEDTDAILRIVEIINDITESTNILAINAGIESAHSGQYGKGFRVIADEITKLVETTKKRSLEISILLKEQVKKIRNGLTESDESGKAFRQISAEVNSAIEAWIKISEEADMMSKTTGTIQNSTQQMSQITKNVRDSSETIKNGVEKVNEEIIDLDETSARTMDVIEKVTITNEEAKTSTVQILQQLNEMGKFVLTLNKTIDFFNLGKKVFILFPDKEMQDNTAREIVRREYEAFPVQEYKLLLRYARESGNSIIFINSDNCPEGFDLNEFILLLKKAAEGKNIKIGILSLDKKYKMNEKWDKSLCELIYLEKNRKDENLKIFLSFIEKNKARGLRKFIRVNCEIDDKIAVETVIDNNEFRGKVVNISSNSLLCKCDEDKPIENMKKKFEITLKCKDEEQIIPCQEIILKANRHNLIIFDDKIPSDRRQLLQELIYTKLQEKMKKELKRN